MPTAIPRVVLRDVSRDLYERVIAEVEDQPGKRFAYFDGALEIMLASSGHEFLNRTLAQLGEVVALVTRRDLFRSGSTTFKRSDLHAGFEPDSSFYFEYASVARGKEAIDLAVDPPPELLIEIDLSSNSLNKLPLFGALGIREVWRYSKQRVTILRLEGGRYGVIDKSIALPPISAEAAERFLKASREVNSVAWDNAVREWVRSATSSRSS